MLDLIDDGALAELSEKAARIRFRKVPLVGRFQVGILQVGKSCAAERRLTGLARPGHGHKGVLPKQGRQPVCDLALDHGRQGTSLLHTLQVPLADCAVITRLEETPRAPRARESYLILGQAAPRRGWAS